MQPPRSQSRAKWLIFAILALPVAELAVFIAVALRVGFLAAVICVLSISLLGVLLLRQQAQDTRVRFVLNEQRLSSIDLRDVGLHRWLAALLLTVPGFVTGALGGLLLIAPVRRWLGQWIGRQVQSKTPTDPSIVDLEDKDWRDVPQQRLENRRDIER